MSIITLTTDFGGADWFVGSLKGVMLAANPQGRLVDISHEIPPGDIRTGAFVLAAAFRCFPRLTVHLAVVDPGVGSSRAAIAVRTADYFFVGPDNGVLSLALAAEEIIEIRRLENKVYFRQPVSPTFQARDIFAPVAVRLTQGILLDSLGPRLPDHTRLGWTAPRVVGDILTGEVLHLDHFGNAITNIDAPRLAHLKAGAARVLVRGVEVCALKTHYQEVPAGQPVAVIGSSGFLEIAINGGHAAATLGLKAGDPVGVK